MDYKKLFLLIFNIFFASLDSKAQVWEVGLNAGGAGYIGDLNQNKVVNVSGLNLGGFVRANWDAYWSLGLHINYGKIKASDADADNQQQRNRNLSFETPMTEVALLVDFNFLEYFSGGGLKRFTPYLQVGGGLTSFNPKTEYNGSKYELSLLKTEGQDNPYKKVAPALIYGGGIKWNTGGNWSFLANMSYRQAYTDYLDDVSGNYADPSRFDQSKQQGKEGFILSDRSPEIGLPRNTPGTQRGDFRKRDNYLFVGIGISYTFVSQKCF